MFYTVTVRIDAAHRVPLHEAGPGGGGYSRKYASCRSIAAPQNIRIRLFEKLYIESKYNG